MSVGTTVILNSLLLFSPEAELSNQLKQLEPNLMASQFAQCNSNDVGAALKTIQEFGLFTPSLAPNLDPISLIEMINTEKSSDQSTQYDFAFINGEELYNTTGQTSAYYDMQIHPFYQFYTTYNVLEYRVDIADAGPYPAQKRLAKVVFDYSPSCDGSSFPSFLLAEVGVKNITPITLEIGIASEKYFPVRHFSIPVWTEKGHEIEHVGEIYFGGDFSGKGLKLSNAAFAYDIENQKLAGRSGVDLKLPFSSLRLGETNIEVYPDLTQQGSYTVKLAAQPSFENIVSFVNATDAFNLPDGVNTNVQAYISMNHSLGVMTAAQVDIRLQNIDFNVQKLSQGMTNVLKDKILNFKSGAVGEVTSVVNDIVQIGDYFIPFDLTKDAVIKRGPKTTVSIEHLNINAGYNLINTSINDFDVDLKINVEICQKLAVEVPLTGAEMVFTEICHSQNFDQSFNPM